MGYGERRGESFGKSLDFNTILKMVESLMIDSLLEKPNILLLLYKEREGRRGNVYYGEIFRNSPYRLDLIGCGYMNEEKRMKRNFPETNFKTCITLNLI
jgi:hypothetical protein